MTTVVIGGTRRYYVSSAQSTAHWLILILVQATEDVFLSVSVLKVKKVPYYGIVLRVTGGLLQIWPMKKPLDS